jgi:hypothetical protein
MMDFDRWLCPATLTDVPGAQQDLSPPRRPRRAIEVRFVVETSLHWLLPRPQPADLRQQLPHIQLVALPRIAPLVLTTFDAEQAAIPIRVAEAKAVPAALRAVLQLPRHQPAAAAGHTDQAAAVFEDQHAYLLSRSATLA